MRVIMKTAVPIALVRPSLGLIHTVYSCLFGTGITLPRGDGDEDDLEDLGWQNSIPNTFGKESDKLGKPLSSGFGSGFLQKVAAGGKEAGGTGLVGKALLEDEEVKSYVKKYAGNSKVCTG